MGASRSFLQYDTIRFTNKVYLDDVLTGPVTNTWVVEEPDGTDQALTEASDDDGIVYATFVPTQVGWHKVQFKGAGNSVDYVKERQFYVTISNGTEGGGGGGG